MKLISLTALALCCLSNTAGADELEDAMRSFVMQNVADWASDPLLVQAIRKQNVTTASMNQETIDQMDAMWQAESGVVCSILHIEVLGNETASFLRQNVAESDGAITEALLMDAKGLNVAATQLTTDYWQGDEPKYTETYLVGPDAIHFGDIELDESTQIVQGQASLTIVDQVTGEPIGALTVGIALEALM